MPLPRYKQINTDITPYYHCTSRCVRQSFLCGRDKRTGANYEHRRKWITDRLHKLSQAFAIDLCAYAVMHNHIHVVLHIAKGRADGWSMDEVLLRWRMFYKCPPIVQRYLDDQHQAFTEKESDKIKSLSVQYRERLQNISWFMRLLNEYIARRANKEDECTGYFWERRFRSQAILDEKALAAVMAYVDLNPIRANIATSLQTSKHTSIHYRMNAQRVRKTPKYLMVFNDQAIKTQPHLPFNYYDYISLVEATFKAHKDKCTSKIPKLPHGLLSKIGMDQEKWRLLTSRFETFFSGPVGNESKMRKFADGCNRGSRPNVKNAIKYLS